MNLPDVARDFPRFPMACVPPEGSSEALAQEILRIVDKHGFPALIRDLSPLVAAIDRDRGRQAIKRQAERVSPFPVDRIRRPDPEPEPDGAACA